MNSLFKRRSNPASTVSRILRAQHAYGLTPTQSTHYDCHPAFASADNHVRFFSSELDRARGAAATNNSGFSGSIFGAGSGSGSSIPPELKDLVAPQQNVAQQFLPVKSSLSTANAEYDKLMDPAAPLPAPPVYAARLNGLLKHLASAESAVAESVKARQELVAALDRILDTNRQALAEDEKQLREVGSRKSEIENKKQEVELAIMRNLGTGDEARMSPGDGSSVSPPPEPDRPEVEALTPPSAHDDYDFHDSPPRPQNGHPHSPAPLYPQSPVAPPQAHQQPAYQSSAPGIEMLSNLASQYQAVPVAAAVNGSNKRRRVDSGSEEFPDMGKDDGIEADVAEILRQDNRTS